MKKINKFNLLILALIVLAGIVSFTTPSSSNHKNTPSIVCNVATIEDTLTDADAAAELQLFYEYLVSAGYGISDEFLENYYPAVAYLARAVVVATRALTRNTPVVQQLTVGLAAVVGNVLANLLFFAYNDNGIEEKVLEKNFEEYKIYCLG